MVANDQLMSRSCVGEPGDEERFSKLFRAHYPRVLAYVRRRVRSDGVDDVVAETFLTAWRRLDDLPPDALPWLLAVARKTISTHRRTVERRESLIRRLRFTSVREQPQFRNETVAHRPVDAALASLRSRERELITLIAWDGLTPTEAAAVLGESAVAVRVRLHRARRRLRSHLEREERLQPTARNAVPPTSLPTTEEKS